MPLVEKHQNTPTYVEWVENVSSDFPTFDPKGFIPGLDGPSTIVGVSRPVSTVGSVHNQEYEEPDASVDDNVRNDSGSTCNQSNMSSVQSVPPAESPVEEPAPAHVSDTESIQSAWSRRC